MKKSEKDEIVLARNYKVVKSNDIIREARYELSITELKVFSFVLSKIKPSDIAFQEYAFTVNEICDVLGMGKNNGMNIKQIKKALKQLRDKSFYLQLDDGSETTVGWLDKVWINAGSGKVRVRMDEDLQKYVVGLFENFTQYQLLCVLPMRSSYSIRIYEMLKSYAYAGSHVFDIDDMKRMLGCTHYKRFPDFRRKVLEIATREINQYTDLEISWEPVKKGQKVEAVEFQIKQLDVWGQMKRQTKAHEALDNRQMTIADFMGKDNE